MKTKLIVIFICILITICTIYNVVASMSVEKQRLVIQSNSDRQVGNTLITELGGDRVIEVNCSGTIVWELDDLLHPIDAERLENGNTLITIYFFASNCVIEVDPEGTIVWEFDSGLYGPMDAERLSNGNTLIADTYNNRVIEVDSSGTIVWQKTGLNMSTDVERLENGNTLITDLGKGHVIEVDSDGTIVWEKASLNAVTDAERLENGNTLITEGGLNHVIEVNSSGNIVWEYNSTDSSFLVDAERLSNGNTLIVENGFNRVIEVDSSGTIVWQKTGLGEPFDAERIYNEPPNIPATPNGPTWLNLNAEGTYNTSASDPDGDNVQYRFDWDANGSHDYSDWTDFVPSGTQANISHSWDTGGTYVVKAQARDEHYETSGWTNDLSVFVNSPPNAPSDPEPEDGATEVDIEADLSWSCSDPDGDNLTYDVYFEADDPTPDELVSEGQLESWYDPGTMEYGTHYYWQIVAWDEYGISIEGSVWDFTTGLEPNDPPDSPSNPDPLDGATDVDINADFGWSCSDPDGDNITYDVYLDTVNPPVDKVSDDQVETTFDPGPLDFQTMYYWQIIAKDEHDASTAGPIWHFTTEEEPNEPPGEPNINGPNTGMPDKEICWTFISTDPNDDDLKYYIEWGDGTNTTTDCYPSGATVEECHTYSETGTYIIKAKAVECPPKDLESDWTEHQVIIPRGKISLNTIVFRFFQRFPYAFPILRQLLGL